MRLERRVAKFSWKVSADTLAESQNAFKFFNKPNRMNNYIFQVTSNQLLSPDPLVHRRMTGSGLMLKVAQVSIHRNDKKKLHLIFFLVSISKKLWRIQKEYKMFDFKSPISTNNKIWFVREVEFSIFMQSSLLSRFFIFHILNIFFIC